MLGEESREPRTGTGPSLSPLPPCPRALSPSWAALAPGGTDVLLKSVVNVWSQLSTEMSEVSCLCLKSVVYSRYLKSVVYWDIWSQLSSEMSDLQTDVSLLQLPRVGDPGPAGVRPPVTLPHRLDDQAVRLYHVPVTCRQDKQLVNSHN